MTTMTGTWTVNVTPDRNRPGSYIVAAGYRVDGRLALTIRRDRLDADQAAHFDPETEWAKGLPR